MPTIGVSQMKPRSIKGELNKYPEVAIMVSKGKNMASKINKQDDKVIKYLEKARENLGLYQEEMAEKCGVSLAQYKRYIYKKCKIPATVLITLAETGLVDSEFLLTGRTEPAKTKFTQLLSVADSKEKIAMMYEAYMYYSQIERSRDIKEAEKQKAKTEKRRK